MYVRTGCVLPLAVYRKTDTRLVLDGDGLEDNKQEGYT